MSPRYAGSSLLEAPLPQAGDAVRPGFDVAIRSEPSSVEIIRRVTRAWARYCELPDDLVDTLLVVVSELCTNAVLHGRREAFDVRGWMPAAGQLRFEVHDKTPSVIPQPQHPDPESESGRGLLLVDVLITELGGTWGFIENGTCAWCSLPLPGNGR
ncbi:ATP-binding protein [Streptomyces sp. NPDC001982]|uniref:ATP-binding protein n=1 Tax=Streptomyces sp. NPDC001982 TaxID=3154405 RepID=UPI003329CECA